MVCDYHAPVSLAMSAIWPGPLTFHWKRNGADIVDEQCTGVDEPTLTITSFSLKHEGSYSCQVKHEEMVIESKSAEVQLSKQIKLCIYYWLTH